MGKEKQEWTKIFLSSTANRIYLEGSILHDSNFWGASGMKNFCWDPYVNQVQKLKLGYFSTERKTNAHWVVPKQLGHAIPWFICLLLMEHHGWFFQGENPILFYQAANATKVY